MSTITTAMIKELREATGAGPLDCKKALEASGGDMAAAKDALREKGMAMALKKTERVMNAGRVVVAAADAAVALVEVKCETDFVSNTPDARYVGAYNIPAAVLEEQRAKLTEELATDSKPETIKAKIVQGRLDKFTQAVCLLPQPFIRDDRVTVEQLLQQRGARVVRFTRLEPAEAVGSG